MVSRNDDIDELTLRFFFWLQSVCSLVTVRSVTGHWSQHVPFRAELVRSLAGLARIGEVRIGKAGDDLGSATSRWT